MPLQLRNLRTFALAAQHLSFKQAADELCLSASAVSHQISDLESDLGVKLFTRLTRSITLTERGAQYYADLQPHLQAIENATLELKQSTKRTPLLVQLPEFLASELLMPVISNFSDQYQNIDLRIESMDSSGKPNPLADINIVLTRKTPSALHVEKLFPIRYIPACSRALFADWTRKGFSGIDAINVSTILLHKARPQAWTLWAKHVGIDNMKPKQIIFVDSMFKLVRAAEQSAGIAMVPMPVSKAWFDSGALVPLHDIDLVTQDYYWVTMNENTRNKKAAETFWRWITENLQFHSTTTGEENSSVA